jgi:Cys-tRNA(Pro)/Cys-tRNA(Cys) deacylase
VTPAVNAARRAGIPFTLHEYRHDPRAESYGLEAAEALGLEVDRVFKTLVAAPEGRGLWIAVVPVAGLLDVKALAQAAGAKRATMADPKVAERATGYVVGGISPLGQRQRLSTVVDASALQFGTIFVSAGRRGLEIELAPGDLIRLCSAVVAPIGRPTEQ